MGVTKNKFAPLPCLFPPTPHLFAILHQIIIGIFNYTKKKLPYPSQPTNLQNHTHSIQNCVSPNSGNNCPFHANHFIPLLYLLYPPLLHPLPLNTLSPSKTYMKTTLWLKLKVSRMWNIMSIPNLKTSKSIPPPGVPKYPSSWINGCSSNNLCNKKGGCST